MMFKKKERRFSAVILAGGMSTRTGGISKQQYELCGIPVAVRSMLAFEHCFFCEEILVVSRVDECALYDTLCARHGITKFKKAVPGGSTRQESAFIGLENISENIPYIALHDAARCLVTTEQIEAVFADALKYRSATAACKAADTVKLVDDNGKTRIENQPDRSTLCYMQTPQIFYADLYRAAAYTARSDGFKATDDCSLLEHAGFGVKTVDCGHENMKITTPIDFIIAEAIVKAREDKNGKI